MNNKILKVGAALALVLVFGCGAVYASDETNVTIPSGENVPTDLIRAGQTVDVGADIAGDAILAGSNVSFSGNTAGDILLAGGNARVNGDSSGDVRVVGGNVILNGIVEKNVTVVGGSVIVEEGSVVRGNLYAAGGSVELRGKVEGNATVYGAQLLFAGAVGGDADFKSTSAVIIRQDASVGGDLTYTGATDIAIEQGKVGGTITRVPIEEVAQNKDRNDGDATLGLMVWQLLSLLLVGFVLFKFFGKQVRELTGPIKKEELWNRIAFGLLSFLLNSALIAITFLTIIGVPLALMILFVYVILIIVAATISPMLIGRLFNGKFKLYAQDEKYLMVDFVLGYVLMQVTGLIPFVGPLALIILFLFSFGRVSQYIAVMLKANR